MNKYKKLILYFGLGSSLLIFAIFLPIAITVDSDISERIFFITAGIILLIGLIEWFIFRSDINKIKKEEKVMSEEQLVTYATKDQFKARVRRLLTFFSVLLIDLASIAISVVAIYYG